MKKPNDEGAKLRREISNRETARSRLSGELRRRCEQYSAARAGAGASPRAIASELGVSAMSVKRWLRSRPTTTATMIPVRVIAAAVDRAQTEALVTVTTPNGLRVDGLQFDALCTLIARFG